MATKNGLITFNLAENSDFISYIQRTPISILSRLADEFNLDKNTIETIYTNAAPGAKSVPPYGAFFTVATIQYQDVWISLRFGIRYYSRDYASAIENYNFGSSISYDSRPIPREGNGAPVPFHKPNLSGGSDGQYRWEDYNGIAINFAIVKDKTDMAWCDGSIYTKFQPTMQDTFFYDAKEKKQKLSFRLGYFINKENGLLLLYGFDYYRNASILQMGYLKTNDGMSCFLYSDFYLSNEINNYSLNPNYGILTGNFSNIIKNNQRFIILLPCYLCSNDGAKIYCDYFIQDWYKGQGDFKTNQSYVINGMMYLCIAASGNNAILINRQMSYEEWRKEH